MALESSILRVPFTGGIDQQADNRLLELGKQSTLTNAIRLRTGGVQKRRGYSYLGTVAGGARLVSYKDEIDVLDGTFLWSYSPAAAAFIKQDEVSPCAVTWGGVDQIPQPPNSALNIAAMDVAYGNGLILYGWSTNTPGPIYAAVVDATTGATVLPAQQIDSTNSVGPRLAVVGTTAAIFWVNGSSNLVAKTLNLSNPTTGWGAVGGLITIASSVSRPDAWDVAASATVFAVAWLNATSGNTAVSVGILSTPNLSMTVGPVTPTLANTLAVRQVALTITDSERVGLLFGQYDGTTTAVYAVGLKNSNLTLQDALLAAGGFTGNTGQQLGVCRLTSTTAACIGGFNQGPSGIMWSSFTWGGAGAFVHQTPSGLPWFLLSRPFLAPNGHAYALIQYRSSLQGSVFLMDLEVPDAVNTYNGRIVARIAPRQSLFTTQYTQGPLASSIAALSATQFIGVCSVVKSATVRSGVEKVLLDFGAGSRWQPAEIGDAVHLSGGCPQSYDGALCVEESFHVYPEQPTTSLGGTGITGSYQYIVTYEWTDARGQRHQSTPSVASAVVSPSNQTVTVQAQALAFTDRYDPAYTAANVDIVFWRTLSGGSVYYRLQQAANTNAAATVQITDAASDASISTSETLYTLGGDLPNMCPPSLVSVITHKNRLWGIAGDQRTIWYSTQFTQGEAPRWNDAFTFSVDDGRPCIALASQDDKLVIFKNDSIYFVSGAGPNSTGTQNDLTDPTRVNTPAGCIEPRSVVVSNDGTWFQGRRTLSLLTRSLEVEEQGTPVVDSIQNQVVTSATYVRGQGHVRWTVVPTQGSATGSIVVYDNYHESWSLISVYNQQVPQAGAAPVSGYFLNGPFYWLGQDGSVFQENAVTGQYQDGSTLDAAHWITFTVESAWIKARDLQGLARFWGLELLGQSLDPHDLTVSLAFDYSTTYSQVATFSAQTIASFVNGIEQLEMWLQTQKLESLRVKITDAFPTSLAPTTGQGPSLQGIELQVGLYKNLHRLPKAQGA